MNPSLEIFVGMSLFFINDKLKQMNHNSSWYFSNYIHEDVIENISVICKEYFDTNFNMKKYDYYLEVKCKNHILYFFQDTFKYVKNKSLDINFNTFKTFHDMQKYNFFVDEDFLINQNAFSQRIFAFNKLMDEMNV